jgi:hypothetical protein
MFGKPHWFRLKVRGWGLRPVHWRGWAYTLIWTLVIALPFCALATFGRAPEAFIWLAVTGGVLAWDVRQIRAAIRAAAVPPDIEFLEESQRGQSTLATRAFRMHMDRE